MAEFIVAIELGSSVFRGIAGKKNLDGSITVQALVKEDATQCIRKGVVNNIDKTATCLKNIVAKLSKTMKQNISHVYVGVGGQSVRSVRNVIVKDLPTETIVDGDIVDGLMDSNRGMDYPDLEILNVVTQEYKVGNQYVVDPVGIKGTRLEGNFLNIAQRKLFYSNLNEAFDKAGIAIAEIFPAPLVLADNVLSESEKRGGCVLVDLGADTTTVSVYHKSLLRHLAVIPLGGNNVTKDITALKMEEREAELLKLKHGSAYTEIADMDPALTYSIDGERTIESKQLIELVEARVEEIVQNVWHQVPAEYVSKLLGGIILTGGGSNMKNIELAFKKYTHMDKIRKARFVNLAIKSNIADINKHDTTLNTIISLLAKGDMNCAGGPIVHQQSTGTDLFGQTTTTTTPHQTTNGEGGTQPHTGGDNGGNGGNGGKNTQPTPPPAPEPTHDPEPTPAPEKSGFFSKFTKKIKRFGGKILEAEE